jgi:hypothetical protein
VSSGQADAHRDTTSTPGEGGVGGVHPAPAVLSPTRKLSTWTKKAYRTLTGGGLVGGLPGEIWQKRLVSSADGFVPNAQAWACRSYRYWKVNVFSKAVSKPWLFREEPERNAAYATAPLGTTLSCANTALAHVCNGVDWAYAILRSAPNRQPSCLDRRNGAVARWDSVISLPLLAPEQPVGRRCAGKPSR